MVGKVCMITGATGDMGRVISTDLARRGATALLVCRDRETGETLRHAITNATGNPRVHVLTADLSDQTSIRQLVDRFHQRHTSLHVLVNNAGAHLPRRCLSIDGVEMHLAVNHLSWFLLTNLLLDSLIASAPARVINVASQTISDTRQIKLRNRPRPVTLNLDDLQAEHDFKPMHAYARAKLAMIMCGYHLARQLDGTGVTVNALHPGLVATGMVTDMAPTVMKPFLGIVRAFLLTPEQGARTAIHLATSRQVEGVTGKYYISNAEHASPDISYDTTLQERLWQASAQLVGLTRYPHQP
jgi:NAD(P)-dependent dehydrogenase (short-subunit alcohol dehydrogenase family)